jgi:hypothetical protein
MCIIARYVKHTRVRCYGEIAVFSVTVKLHLSGLIGTTSHPDVQKNLDNWIFPPPLENRLHWQSEVEKFATNGCFMLHFIYVQIKHKYTIPYIFDKWGKNLSHNEMYYNYSKKMFTGRAKPIRIIGDPDNWRFG